MNLLKNFVIFRAGVFCIMLFSVVLNLCLVFRIRLNKEWVQLIDSAIGGWLCVVGGVRLLCLKIFWVDLIFFENCIKNKCIRFFLCVFVLVRG